MVFNISQPIDKLANKKLFIESMYSYRMQMLRRRNIVSNICSPRMLD